MDVDVLVFAFIGIICFNKIKFCLSGCPRRFLLILRKFQTFTKFDNGFLILGNAFLRGIIHYARLAIVE